MPSSDAQLLELAESSFLLWAPLPGRHDAISVAGVGGRISNLTNPLANIVSCARFSEAEAAERVAEVSAIYESADRPICWIAGPASTPRDLPERLIAAGFMRDIPCDALVLRDLETEIPLNPDVEVREIEKGEVSEYQTMMGTSYGIPEEVIELLFDAQSGSSCVSRTYIAFLAGEPVSWGMSLEIPDTTVVLLSGAGTAPEHRGLGIYKSLVARRLRDAAASGMDTALIQAVATTSSPICQRLGFERIGVLEVLIRPSPSMRAEQQAAG